jgi:5-methylthioribose kinase
MVRRVIGLSHVIDIDRIPVAAVREKAQRLALTIGTSLIRNNRKTQSIEEVIELVNSAASK